MEKEWKYLQNQFSVATRDNYKKAVKLSNYHDADLNTKKATEPLLIPIYTRYHEVHLALVSEYNKWHSSSGSQEGKTAALKLLLNETYKKMNAWDVAIQVQFLKGTPSYISIFPDGRKPFTTGSIDGRINAYDTLAKNLEPYAALATTRDEIAVAYAELDATRDMQEGSKGTKKVDSGNVEAARMNAMNMQYRDLGFAMDNFSTKTDYIASMFDLETLRENRQSEFTGTLSPSETKAILVRTFLGDDELSLKSNGAANLKFYLASTAGGTNSDAISVLANEEITVTISDFNAANLGTHRFLTVVNQSVSDSTQFIVTIE